MATIMPKVSRASPSFSRLAGAAPRVISGSSATLRAAGYMPRRVSNSNHNQPRCVSTRITPSSRRNITQAAQSVPRGVLPEFDLKGKVIIVSGGAQGLGVVQAEALLEAGATGRHFPSTDNETLQETLLTDVTSPRARSSTRTVS